MGKMDRPIRRDLKTEAGTTDNTPRPHNDIISKIAMRQHGVRINPASPANPDSMMDDHPRPNDRTLTDDHIFAGNNAGPDLDPGPVRVRLVTPAALPVRSQHGQSRGEITTRRVAYQAYGLRWQRCAQVRCRHHHSAGKPRHVKPALLTGQERQVTIASP